MAGHFQATESRLAETGGRILPLRDTCEFSFQRDQDSALGLIGRAVSGKGTVAGRMKRPLGRGTHRIEARNKLVRWRGLTRLHDIQLGCLLANELVAN